MRENFRGNKRRKEELRKKKQEEKRNKRLNKRTADPLTTQPDSGVTGEAAAASPVQDQ